MLGAGVGRVLNDRYIKATLPLMIGFQHHTWQCVWFPGARHHGIAPDSRRAHGRIPSCLSLWGVVCKVHAGVGGCGTRVMVIGKRL